MLRFSDARNFGRTATGLLLIVGPVLLIVATLIGPKDNYGNSTHDKLKELANVAAHKGTYLLSGIIFLVAMIALLFAAFGLIKYFRGPRGVTLGQVSGVLLAIGSMVGAGWYAFGVAEYEMVNHASLNGPVPRGIFATYLHITNNTSSGLPLFLMFLVGVTLGLILLGVAAIRTRVVPIWVGVLLIVSGPAAFVSNGKAAQTVANLITLVALGALGWRALTMSDEEWDAPLERKALPVVPEAPVAPTPAPAA